MEQISYKFHAYNPQAGCCRQIEIAIKYIASYIVSVHSFVSPDHQRDNQKCLAVCVQPHSKWTV